MIAEHDRSRATALAWLQANRLGVAALVGVIWMAAMFPIVQDAVISVICGTVVTAILAAALPRRIGPREGNADE